MSPTRDFGDNLLPMFDLNPSHYKLEFVEQPSHEFRYRYLSEFKKGSHGCLKSDRGKRRKEGGGPIIKVNYTGTLDVEVGLYTAIEPRREHVHKLVEGSKIDNKIGKVFFKVAVNGLTNPNEWMNIELRNMNILHMGKDEVDKYIKDWLLKCKKMSIADFEKQSVKQKKSFEEELKEKKREIENNVVLGVKIYVDDQLIAGPCFSNKISNTKTIKKLNIEDISKVSGCCTGGDEIFILCDKLKLEDIDKSDPEKSDIAIEFYDLSEDSQWNAKAKIIKIHHQAAIVFVTPPYKDINLYQPQEVEMRLIRKSDNETSDSRQFTYEPIHDEIELRKKRLKTFHPAKDNGRKTKNDRPNEVEKAAHGLLTLSRGRATSSNSQVLGQEHDGSSGQVLDQKHDSSSEQFLCQEHDSSSEQFLGQEHDSSSGQVLDQKHDSSSEQFLGQEHDSSSEQFLGQEHDSSSDLFNFLNNFLSGIPAEELSHTINAMADSANDGPMFSGNTNDDVEMDFGKKIVTIEEQLSSLKLFNDESNVDEKINAVEDKLSDPLNSKHNILALLYRLVLHTANYLHDYAKTGDINILLMSMRHLIAMEDEHGNNVIHSSVLHSKIHVLKRFLEVARTVSEYDVLNQVNQLNQSPLHLAVMKNEEKIVKLLLYYGVNPNLRDINGNSAIHLSAQKATSLCLPVILDTLHYAFKFTNHKPNLDMRNYEGFTPLHLAVLNNSLENVKQLCSASCNLNLQDYHSGRSALHLAVENENVEIVELLLYNTIAEIDLHMFNGNTPLHLAVMRNNLEIVKLLMEAKADPYLENNRIFDKYENLEENAISGDFRGWTSLDLARSHEIRNCLMGYPTSELLTENTSLSEETLHEKSISICEFSRKYTLDSGIGLSDMNFSSTLSTGIVSEKSKQSLADILDYRIIDKLAILLNMKNCEKILNSMDKSELIDIVGIKENPIKAMLKLLQIEDEVKFTKSLAESGFQEALQLFNSGRLIT